MIFDEMKDAEVVVMAPTRVRGHEGVHALFLKRIDVSAEKNQYHAKAVVEEGPLKIIRLFSEHAIRGYFKLFDRTPDADQLKGNWLLIDQRNSGIALVDFSSATWMVNARGIQDEESDPLKFGYFINQSGGMGKALAPFYREGLDKVGSQRHAIDNRARLGRLAEHVSAFMAVLNPSAVEAAQAEVTVARIPLAAGPKTAAVPAEAPAAAREAAPQAKGPFRVFEGAGGSSRVAREKTALRVV